MVCHLRRLLLGNRHPDRSRTRQRLRAFRVLCELVEEAISAAVNNGDFAPFENLLAVLAKPFGNLSATFAKVMALAQARKIDAILVTELSRWGRSTQDLISTLHDLHGWKVSVLAQNGLAFDLSTSTGKLMTTIMAGLADFERDIIKERKSGLAAASARGVKLGRQVGQRPSDKKAAKVRKLQEDGLSYRLIARNVGLSKNTVMEIVRRPGA